MPRYTTHTRATHSVPGANYVKGAVMLPQQIGMAASFDTALAETFGFITGRDTRAAGMCTHIAGSRYVQL